MATPEDSSRKVDCIEFTLNVKAGRTKDWVEFGLNLNPNDRLISISESFSSYEELSKVFNLILSELKIINDRTRLYNSAVSVTKTKSATFKEGYEQNFKPEFGKIDRVIHRHNSPGVSSVSYVRAYNGDMQPK